MFDKMVGNPSEDDMEIGHVIANMAADVAGAEQPAKAYLNDIAEKHPAVSRLFARIGRAIEEGKGATKQ